MISQQPEPEPVADDNWSWRYLDESGVVVHGPGVAFESQQGAEDWLAENFAELSAAGITAVTLFDGEHTVYGPMPLTA